jgi:inhibitor of KinA
MNPPRFLDAGETALVVEFGQTIDPAINARVLALDAALAANAPPGLLEQVPTYRSLMLHYNPLVISRQELVAVATNCLNTAAPISAARKLWTLPACYHPDFAEDLEHISASTGLAPAMVIARHASARYLVCMYGFAPGWAYLSGLPQALTLPRRAAPRALIPAGSLIIAGGQAIVATMAMPSGWHILGRTPERLFRADRDPAFLVAVGDALTFEPVSRSAYDALCLRAEAGETLARAVPL